MGYTVARPPVFFTEGDVIRVKTVDDLRTKPFWEGKIAVVLTAYGYRVMAQRIINSHIPGVIRECAMNDCERVDQSTMTEREWANYCAWRLTQ